MCFVFIWEQTATCATYSIHWLVFITEMKSLLRGTNWVFKGLRSTDEQPSVILFIRHIQSVCRKVITECTPSRNSRTAVFKHLIALRLRYSLYRLLAQCAWYTQSCQIRHKLHKCKFIFFCKKKSTWRQPKSDLNPPKPEKGGEAGRWNVVTLIVINY